jgi:hypothetical protein
MSCYAIRQMLQDWYGLPLPMMIVPMSQDIEEFEADHPEVPREFWNHFNHATRLMSRWIRDADMDFVVWNEPSKSYRLVQDVCFKDAYPSDDLWYKTIQETIADPSRKVFVVTYGCCDDAWSPRSPPLNASTLRS